VVALAPAAALAQFDPAAGEFGKSHDTDLRVMTWNVRDSIASANPNKGNTFSAWNLCARIVAMLEPDVLVLQEAGDNSNYPLGGNGDSVTSLRTAVELFVSGGNDPVIGGSVGSYVQLFNPDLDYPHVFVSTSSDGFNRNVILSRYPFADLNNDPLDESQYSNIFVQPDTSWFSDAPGGTGGIRGVQFAEIDLPDSVYLGDVVVGNAHLKAGGSGSDFSQREVAAKNIAYWIQFFYNGNGTGTPDPNNAIPTFDDANTTVLDPNTPVIFAGDLNQTLTGFAPAEIISWGPTLGGAVDGTDRDQTDSTFDDARNAYDASDATTQGSSKLDYVIWQDSIAQARRQFLFRTTFIPGGFVQPPELADIAQTPGASFTAISTFASDHRPVIVDFILPLAPVVNCPQDVDGDDAVGTSDLLVLLANWGTNDGSATIAQGDIDGDGNVGTSDLLALLAAWGCV
jgi:endonuclease/exonuclease/phosphatase family metal-dependent hydrolase